MNYVALLQWPAMIVTVVAAWLVAANTNRKRDIGFWCFLASNALWIAWGLQDKAYALVALQLCLGIMNVRGAYKAHHARRARQ